LHDLFAEMFSNLMQVILAGAKVNDVSLQLLLNHFRRGLNDCILLLCLASLLF